LWSYTNRSGALQV
jgi:hypothetical protein